MRGVLRFLGIDSSLSETLYTMLSGAPPGKWQDIMEEVTKPMFRKGCFT